MGLSVLHEREKIPKNTLPRTLQQSLSSRKHTIINDIQSIRELKKSSTQHRCSVKFLKRLSTTALRLPNKLISKNSCSLPIQSNDHSDTIPSWLSAREDFKQNCIKLQERAVSDLYQVAKIPYPQRTSEESEVLYLWIRQTEFFKSVPQGIVRELCNALSAEHFFPYERIIEKGSRGECLYIVYKGRVNILLDGEQKAHVDPGGYFGELALDKDLVRTADAVTDRETYLFVLKDCDYKRIVFSLKKLEKSLNIKLLVNIPLFAGISFNKLQNILNSCALAVFNPGEKIYDIDSQSNSFYILQEGHIELQIIIEIEKINKWPIGPKSWNIRKVKKKYAVKLKDLKDGQYFGEFEVLKSCSRKMRALAMETCKCLVINSAELKDHYWIKDEKKLSEIRDEYEFGLTNTESVFKVNLKKKAENEEVLKNFIKDESKKGLKLKEVLKARKIQQDKILRKQLIENTKKEKIKGLEIDEDNPIFKTVGISYKKNGMFEKRISKSSKNSLGSGRIQTPFL